MSNDKARIPIPEGCNIAVPTEYLCVIAGFDVNGQHIYAVQWNADNDRGMPNYLTALGMCEAAKIDFIQSVDNLVQGRDE